MEEQYHKLLDLIKKANGDKSFKLEDLLKEVIIFFDNIRGTYVSAPKEEKQELMKMMNQLYTHLQTISKQVSEKSGMTEADLKAYTEDSSNFSEEQWRFLQQSKEKLQTSVKQFSASLRERPGVPQVPKRKRTPKIKKRDWA